MSDSTATLDVNVSKQVHPGLRVDVALKLDRECGVVFGPSGAGKTTLLRLIAGLMKPDAGHVRVGVDVLFDSSSRVNQPLRSRRIAMVFQDDLLFPHLDVAANIRFGLNRLDRKQAESRVNEVAELCGVDQLLSRRPDTLSGGERQRVGLARALAPRPRLLLCDEPISALDLSSRTALVDRLQDVQKVEGIPVLYVTHSPSEAIALGDRLFLFEQGKVIAEGSPLEVLAGSGSPFSGRLESVRNVFRATVVAGPAKGDSELQLVGGPTLVVPRLTLPPGTPVSVAVLAEEILLARGNVEGLSARNIIAAEVERVHSRGDDAEVVVRTGELRWVCSVVAPAVETLGLRPGASASMIIKARSCHVQERPGARPVEDGKTSI